jgi:hypothetical protein
MWIAYAVQDDLGYSFLSLARLSACFVVNRRRQALDVTLATLCRFMRHQLGVNDIPSTSAKFGSQNRLK